ncbi:hypothetical protein [Halapricum salinum]|uniref:CbaC protein n=1 Tax=Halapricum salinum TaxID=1457250 RepID=A0A4D6H9H2_9EURY|nr:hypothetical protein [Halapricum salinum]QCC50714.1 hypothetical protein DV733_05405 [Halapricum salinum]
MVDLHIGRHGVILLAILFVILGFEDVLVWLNSGDLPAIEFFVGLILVLAVIAGAIYEAEQYRPPR